MRISKLSFLDPFSPEQVGILQTMALLMDKEGMTPRDVIDASAIYFQEKQQEGFYPDIKIPANPFPVKRPPGQNDCPSCGLVLVPVITGLMQDKVVGCLSCRFSKII